MSNNAPCHRSQGRRRRRIGRSPLETAFLAALHHAAATNRTFVLPTGRVQSDELRRVLKALAAAKRAGRP
jgi:hypothetical protein